MMSLPFFSVSLRFSKRFSASKSLASRDAWVKSLITKGCVSIGRSRIALDVAAGRMLTEASQNIIFYPNARGAREKLRCRAERQIDGWRLAGNPLAVNRRRHLSRGCLALRVCPAELHSRS